MGINVRNLAALQYPSAPARGTRQPTLVIPSTSYPAITHAQHSRAGLHLCHLAETGTFDDADFVTVTEVVAHVHKSAVPKWGQLRRTTHRF